MSWEPAKEEEASFWLGSVWKDLWRDLQGVPVQGHLHHNFRCEGKVVNHYTSLTVLRKNEFWQRVGSGTTKARRNPKDNCFWEFRNNQQVGKTFSGKLTKKWLWNLTGRIGLALWKMTGMPRVDQEDEEEAEEEKHLAKVLGVKLPKEPQDKEKKNKDNKEAEWELASKITDADTQNEILDKVMKFKTELEKDKASWM